jgi:cardiolipin synthase
LFWPSETARWLALLLFVLAAISDFFDGWIARRYQAASPVGRLFDPIADKLLVGAVIVMLVWTEDAPVIPAIVIICRELLVSGLREYLAEHRVALPVTRLAKWKTTVQMVALAFLLLGIAGPELADGVTTLLVGQVLFWIAAVLTLITGWGYLRSGLRRPAVSDTEEPASPSPAADTTS